MLKECRVVSAGSQNHVDSAGVYIIENTAQKLAVVAVVVYRIVLERVGTCSAAKLARYHRI